MRGEKERAEEQIKELEGKLERADATYQELNTAWVELKNDKWLLEASLKNRIEEIEEKEQAIATLTTENQKLEGWLAEAAKNEKFYAEELERFKYGVSLADPNPVDAPGEIEEETGTNEAAPIKPKSKLLTASELAVWINQNNLGGKSVTAQNVRDWFNKCSVKKQKEMQSQYNFKFSHRDKKGGFWFKIS